MKKAFWCTLAVAWTLAIVGCTDTGPSRSATEKQFQELYKQYSVRFHDNMVGKAETMEPVQVTAEAARIWDETFSPHKDVVEKRIKEILAELDAAKPVDETLYLEIASGSRVEPAPDQPQGIVLKQFLWSPIGAAQMGLNNWLARLLQPQSFGARSVLTANAGLFWEAVDRDFTKPILLQRQGPMIFIVDLSRTEDYYRVDKVRWLRPKSMGPITMPKAPEGTPEGTTAPEKTAPEKAPEKPAEKPAPKPADKAAG